MSDETEPVIVPVTPDDFEELWPDLVRQLEERVDDTRLHNAIAYAAAVCFAGERTVAGALRRYYRDPEFHARCQRVAYLVRSLP